MSTITFTIKENKPKEGENYVSMAFDPIFVEVERVSFPTDKGDRVVSKISFFPNSTITQGDIRQKLGIKGMSVPRATFKIEIDNIKAQEPSKGPSMSSVPQASMKKEPS